MPWLELPVTRLPVEVFVGPALIVMPSPSGLSDPAAVADLVAGDRPARRPRGESRPRWCGRTRSGCSAPCRCCCWRRRRRPGCAARWSRDRRTRSRSIPARCARSARSSRRRRSRPPRRSRLRSRGSRGRARPRWRAWISSPFAFVPESPPISTSGPATVPSARPSTPTVPPVPSTTALVLPTFAVWVVPSTDVFAAVMAGRSVTGRDHGDAAGEQVGQAGAQARMRQAVADHEHRDVPARRLAQDGEARVVQGVAVEDELPQRSLARVVRVDDRVEVEAEVDARDVGAAERHGRDRLGGLPASAGA